MTTEMVSEVTRIEDRLRDGRTLVKTSFREQVAEVANVSSEEEPVVVKLHATIEREGESRGVITIGQYTAHDLYLYSEAPRALFAKHVGKLLSLVRRLTQIPEEDIEFEIESVGLWYEMSKLATFLSISPEHGEIVTVLLMLRDCSANHTLDSAKLRAMESAFHLLHQSVRPTDRVLDKVEDLLETAGFDLNAPMKSIRYDAPTVP